MESCRYCARSVSSVRLLVSISFHFHLYPFISVTDGAGLFYTTPQPTTLDVLRQYVLHTLFVPPAPAPDGALDGAAAPARNAFPFSHKPNTLDRDRIVVPAGWDSWGKIAVLRDGFDAKAWGEVWEHDLESGVDSGGSEAGARKQYAALVQDQGLKARVFHFLLCLHWCQLTTIHNSRRPLPPFNNPTPEQAFLAKNYDENARRADRDPCSIFCSLIASGGRPSLTMLSRRD
jgi:dynein light intermediate chain 1, cytosolic